jgi:Dimerisation domain
MVLMNDSFELHLNPNAIFDMATGFWISKTLMCAVELEVFTKLSGKSLTMDEIQKLLDFQNRHTEAFIMALVSLGLLTSIKRKENGK